MKIAVIGCGLQAGRRVPAIAAHPATEGVTVTGLDAAAAQAFADRHGVGVARSWGQCVEDAAIDAVVICSTPETHADIARAALAAGKHVLCEKPMTRSSATARELATLADEAGVVLKCGLNHRFHPAMRSAAERIHRGDIGRPLLVRGVYGIGGREGIEREWRSDPTRAAGGQLMEQGIHLVDLVRWMAGEIAAVAGATATELFPIAPLEETGVALLSGADGFVATLTSTLLQWRNTFELVVQGERGYLEITGLGGSYGTETLTVGRRDPNAPFGEEKTYFRGADRSWGEEWAHFVAAIRGEVSLMSDGHDAARSMQVVEAVYESARTGQRVELPAPAKGRER